MSACDDTAVDPLSAETTDTPYGTDDCLKVRKWWCFLLSSIFTFLAGLLVVLLWRAFAFICCRKEPDLGPNDPKQKEQKASRQNKQEFEGTFMTEAKDWAGELISGQTTTGRILVSFNYYSITYMNRYIFNLHLAESLTVGKSRQTWLNFSISLGRRTVFRLLLAWTIIQANFLDGSDQMKNLKYL